MELEGQSNQVPVEMVTVPALGPEWGKAELHDMTKRAKREKKSESRKEKWKQWNRGERGMCGSYCTTQGKYLYGLYLSCVLCKFILVILFPFNSTCSCFMVGKGWARASLLFSSGTILFF